ncbi:MAG: LPP20 family lipoprotein [Desulfobacterales bacterium]|nr:LPP20 family lipoprotein [Desulfobacterales bacterium]
MKRVRWWVLLILAALVMHCAGGAVKKEEETAKAESFDAQKYLTADAVGPTEGEAKRSALAALAAVFNARVRAETQSTATSYVDGQAGEQFEKQVAQMVRVETDVQLQGAQIGWVHPEEGGGYRALAVLNRDQAAGRWRNELARLQAELDAGQTGLATLKGRLPRLAALNRLAATMAAMAVTETRLSVLGRPAMPVDSDYTAMLAERSQLVNGACFFIEMEGESAAHFAHSLEALITAQGYRLCNSAEQAAGLIRGEVWIQPLALDHRNARFVRALADVTLIDQDSGDRMAAFSENVRKGHMDENEALRQAIDALAQTTAARIQAALGSIGAAPAAETDGR